MTVCGFASWEVHFRYQKENDRDNIRNCLRRMGFENKVKGTTYVLCQMAGFGIVCFQLHGLAVSVSSFARNLALKFENVYTHTHTHTHTHIYIYIYIHTHIYIYIYIHTHTNTLCGGIVLEEALDLSFDRLRMMMVMIFNPLNTELNSICQ